MNRPMRRVATLLAALPAVLSAPVTMYLAVLTVLGVRRDGRTASPGSAGTTKFVVLVPAHNEAAGITSTLESLLAADYPPGSFAVHVVADNCTDATAHVVRRSGVEVHERHAPDDRGKGPALNWLFDRLVDRDTEFDAVAIVDADTVVDPGFLTAMSAVVESGAVAAQGFYTVREPSASAATSLRYAALACRHHVRAQARCRLGASCGLYGNGMVLRRDVLARRRWSGHLVEDAEFQIDLVLAGHRVVYVPGAVVRAEMPIELEQAVTQNRRWERGRIELARQAIPALVRRMRSTPASRVAAGDAALDLLTPPLSVLGGFHAVAALSAGIGVAARVPRSRPLAIAHLVGVTVVVSHVVAGLVSVRAGARHFTALLSAPRVVIWKVGIWLSVVSRRQTVGWDRTRRNQEATGVIAP